MPNRALRALRASRQLAVASLSVSVFCLGARSGGRESSSAEAGARAPCSEAGPCALCAAHHAVCGCVRARANALEVVCLRAQCALDACAQGHFMTPIPFMTEQTSPAAVGMSRRVRRAASRAHSSIRAQHDSQAASGRRQEPSAQGGGPRVGRRCLLGGLGVVGLAIAAPKEASAGFGPGVSTTGAPRCPKLRVDRGRARPLRVRLLFYVCLRAGDRWGSWERCELSLPMDLSVAQALAAHVSTRREGGGLQRRRDKL